MDEVTAVQPKNATQAPEGIVLNVALDLTTTHIAAGARELCWIYIKK